MSCGSGFHDVLYQYSSLIFYLVYYAVAMSIFKSVNKDCGDTNLFILYFVAFEWTVLTLLMSPYILYLDFVCRITESWAATLVTLLFIFVFTFIIVFILNRVPEERITENNGESREHRITTVSV